MTLAPRLLPLLLIALAVPLARGQPVDSYRQYQQPRELFGVFSLGVTYGGDKLADFRFRSGRSDNIRAGKLVLFGTGIVWQPAYERFSLHTTINYHSDGVLAANVDSSFRRFPVDALLFMKAGHRHRVGAGLSYHLAPRLKIRVAGDENTKAHFDNALGIVVEYNYELVDRVWGGFRYNAIDYRLDGVGKFDGSHVGLMLHYLF